MLRMLFRLIMVTLVLYFLTSCHSTVSNEEAKQNIKTAQINAQLGIAYLEKNNIQRAKRKLLMALDEAPNIPETWYSMAYYFEATGNDEQANKYYLKSIEVAPKRGDAHNNYGTFLCRVGEYQEANRHFMIAANDIDYLNPADAYENAGLCELKQHHNQQAVYYFKRALMQDPMRPISASRLAQLQVKPDKVHSTG